MALFTGVVGELSSQLSEYTPVAPATSAMVASLGALALGSVRAQAQQVAPLPSPRLPSPPLALPRLASPRLPSPPSVTAAPHQPTRLGLPGGFRARLHAPGSAAPAVERPRAAPRRPPHPTQASRELSNLRFQPIGVDAACAVGARPRSGPGAGDGRNAAVGSGRPYLHAVLVH